MKATSLIRLSLLIVTIVFFKGAMAANPISNEQTYPKGFIDSLEKDCSENRPAKAKMIPSPGF